MRYEMEKTSAEHQGAELDDKVDLLRIVALFTAEWRTGLIAAVVAFVIAVIVIERMAPQYEATAVLLPKDQSGGGGSSLASIFSGAKPANNDVSLLVSRTLRDDVVRRADLLHYFNYRSPEAARGRLFAMTKIFPGDTITILVRDKNAAMAARIANAYVAALRSLQESMATTQADLQRKFFEQQLQKEKDALTVAEGDLERTQLGLGIVEAGTQTQIGLSAIAGVRSGITNLQVQLAALLQGSTEQNPDVQRLRSQIAQLQAQERQMESGRGGGGVGSASPAGRMPQANLEFARKQREVQYHEALVNSLASHYETLRMGQGTTINTFDVIDPAIAPEFPTWPPTRLFLLGAAAAALLLGLVAIAMQLLGRRILADPVQRTHLYTIKHNVRLRR